MHCNSLPLLFEFNILFKIFSAKRREKNRLIEKSQNWFCISSDEQKTPEHKKWRSSSLRSEFVDLLWQHYQPTNVYISLSPVFKRERVRAREAPNSTCMQNNPSVWLTPVSAEGSSSSLSTFVSQTLLWGCFAHTTTNVYTLHHFSSSFQYFSLSK